MWDINTGVLVRSPMIFCAFDSEEPIREFVVSGNLKHNVMVLFKRVITAKNAESIRQYLIKRTNEYKGWN